MSQEDHHKNPPTDKSAENDQQSNQTSAKLAGESVTSEQQAAPYEKKFYSFSSSSDKVATTGDDQPLMDLMKRAKAAHHRQSVSEFVIEDTKQGVIHTHRGTERIGGNAAGTPRKSFMDGLKKIFEKASTPAERDQLQGAFSMEYMMRKAKELIGDIQSSIAGKPAAVEKLPYDPSTGTDLTQLPFRPGIDDPTAAPAADIARALGVQVAQAATATAEAIGKQVGQAATDQVTPTALPFRPDIIDNAASEVLPQMPFLPHNPNADLEGVSKLSEKTSSASGPKVPPGGGLHDELKPEYIRSVFNAQSQSSYGGEVLLSNAEIPTGAYDAGQGESLETIAAKHLGSGFTKEQVRAYAREIAQINGLTAQPKDVPLLLPGHDGQGGMTIPGVVNASGDLLLTKHPDGSHTIERHWTLRKAVVHPQRNGDTVEEHCGKGPSDKFFVRHTSDGKTLYQKDATATPYKLNHSKEVHAAHRDLHRLANKLIADPLDRAKFEADMVRFEDRAHKRGLSDQEVAETYKQIARLMEGYVPYGSSDGKCPAPGERLRLAEEVLSQAAEPRTINQGQFMTCQITCVEALIYEKEPSKAAALVADVAMTGRYRSPDGTVVTLDSQSILPQATAYFLDNTRSFATQLFNVTAVNLVYRSSGMNEQYSQDERKQVHHGLEGDQYVIEQINRLREHDTGERLYTKNWLGHTELSKLTPPGLDNDQIIGAYLLVTGRHAEAFKALSNPFDPSNYLSERTPCGVEIAFDEDIAGKGKLVDAIHTEADLRMKLETLAKTQNGFPIMVRVHTQNEPFYSDSGQGTKGGAGGWHAVRITGFVPPNGVKIDNQWDSDVDHEAKPIPLHQLYLAMKRPEKSVIDYERDVVANRKSGNIDTEMEFELLRTKHAVGQLSDYDYGAAVAKRYLEAKQRWQDQQKINKFDQKEKDRAEKLLHDMQKAWQKASPKAAYGFSGAPNL